MDRPGGHHSDLAGRDHVDLHARRASPAASATAAPEPDADAPSRPFLLGTGALVLGRILFGLRNPPVETDTVQYHLPMVAHWLGTGGLGAVGFVPGFLGNFFPGG